jgi:hypothetical protein
MSTTTEERAPRKRHWTFTEKLVLSLFATQGFDPGETAEALTRAARKGHEPLEQRRLYMRVARKLRRGL